MGYFPESVHYGPQERSEGLRTMVLQCGGASGQGYLSVAQREAMNAELNETGEFKKGLYHYTDDDGVAQTAGRLAGDLRAGHGAQAGVRDPAVHRCHRDEPGGL